MTQCTGTQTLSHSTLLRMSVVEFSQMIDSNRLKNNSSSPKTSQPFDWMFRSEYFLAIFESNCYCWDRDIWYWVDDLYAIHRMRWQLEDKVHTLNRSWTLTLYVSLAPCIRFHVMQLDIVWTKSLSSQKTIHDSFKPQSQNQNEARWTERNSNETAAHEIYFCFSWWLFLSLLLFIESFVYICAGFFLLCQFSWNWNGDFQWVHFETTSPACIYSIEIFSLQMYHLWAKLLYWK